MDECPEVELKGLVGIEGALDEVDGVLFIFMRAVEGDLHDVGVGEHVEDSIGVVEGELTDTEPGSLDEEVFLHVGGVMLGRLLLVVWCIWQIVHRRGKRSGLGVRILRHRSLD